MRVIQHLLLLSIFMHFAWVSEADETLTVSLYYPYGYVWVSPYQAIPVLSRYVISMSLKSAEPEPLTTPRPFMTTTTPMGPVTPGTMRPATPTGPVTSPSTPTDPNVTDPFPANMTDLVFSEIPTTTTTRRGDN